MSSAMLERVDVVIDSLLSDETFDDPAGGTRNFRRFVGSMPPKRLESSQEQDFPYYHVSLGPFTFGRTGRNQVVNVKFGIYSSGDESAGWADVDRLYVALADVARQSFNPFPIVGDIDGEVEEFEHPYYTLSIEIPLRGTNNTIC